MFRKSKIYLLLFTITFLLDQVTKFWAIKNLSFQNIKLLKYLNLDLVVNRGVSFGLFNFHTHLPFIILSSFIALIIIGFSAYTFSCLKKDKNIFFEILILSGAISNFIDRILHGGVIDFIDFYVSFWHWPTFNFADVFVFVGIVGMFLRNYFDEIEKN